MNLLAHRTASAVILSVAISLSAFGQSDATKTTDVLNDIGNEDSSSHKSMLPALVVGAASGTVFQTIQSRFQTVQGTGNEDPTPYRMIIYDGNNTSALGLQNNPGARNFLGAGKAVVILNSAEDHLAIGLSGVVWAHAQLSQPRPAVAFLMSQNKHSRGKRFRNRVPLMVQVDFPVHLQAGAKGMPSLPPLNPSPEQLQRDSRAWLHQLIARTTAPGGIGPAVTGEGQTVLAFDHVMPLDDQMLSVLGEAWGASNGQPPPGTTFNSGTSNPFANWTTQASGTFETLVYAMLEGNSTSTYQHKILARQYLLVSPPSPLPLFSTTQYTNTVTGTFPVYAVFGWNSSFGLFAQLQNVPSNALSITENLPEPANSTVSLTTSQSHTESVGVSATGGISNGKPLGTVGVSWTDSWTWGQAQTVSFQDWESQSCVGEVNRNGECSGGTGGSDLGAAYTFDAAAGTDLTDALVQAHFITFPWDNNQLNGNDKPSPTGVCTSPIPSFNQLQTSAMTNQSETVWETSTGTLLPAQTVTLNSIANINSGEIDSIAGSEGWFFPVTVHNCTNNRISNGWSWVQNIEPSVNIALDFSTPGLQPAGWDTAQQTSVPAPWTLQFSQPTASGSEWRANGMLTLEAAQTSPTTINITYVIQPQAPMLTMPATGVCPGNTNSFAPGPGVISSAPLSVTIPAGQRQYNLAPLFEAVGQAYNVQIIAWQPQTTIGDQQVLNPQSAYCVTVPGSQRR